MKYEYKINRSDLILHDVLQSMTIYSYSNDIRTKLDEFILYLDNKLFSNYSDNDIINEELIRLVEYEK